VIDAMTYERIWTQITGVVVAVGVGISILLLRPFVTVAAVALISLAAFMILGLVTDSLHPQTRPAGHSIGRLLARSLSIGGAVIGFAAFFAVSYPVALLLLVVLVSTSPPVMRRLRGRPKRELRVDPENAENAENPARAIGDAAVSGTTESLSPAVCEETDLSATDVTELCRLLRHTFWDLRDTSDPAEKLRLVAHRQRIIDELALRDPEAVLVWLRSGARASGSPEKYFQPKPHSSGSDPA
jgi:hypothetical protein